MHTYTWTYKHHACISGFSGRALVSACSWKQPLKTKHLTYLYHIYLNQVLVNKIFLQIMAKNANRF